MRKRTDIWRRVLGIALLLTTTAVVLAGAAGVAASIEPQEFLGYVPRIAEGVLMTLFLSGLSFAAGFLLSFLLVFASLGSAAVRRVIGFYQNLFRYTPLLAQLYLVYYGAGELAPWLEEMRLWWLFREPMFCVLLVFLMNTTAYQSFIIIGCLEQLPKGQREAGEALGLSPFTLLVKVLMPQALRFSVRPLGNELVGMIKASSVASVVTVFDLLGQTQAIFSETFNLGYFIVAAAVYVILVEMSRIGVERLSDELSVQHRK
jgi:polar amino acid transport system permease protein